MNKYMGKFLKQEVAYSSGSLGLKFSTFKEFYDRELVANRLKYDPFQENFINLLGKIDLNLLKYNKSRAINYLNELQHNYDNPPISQPKGLYIWGAVGTGKSKIMDMFYNHVNIEKKKRVHFHKFCLDLHDRIHLFKLEMLEKYGRDVNINKSMSRDPLIQVANQISDESVLLCFDEFQVTDVADALILKRVFSQIW